MTSSRSRFLTNPRRSMALLISTFSLLAAFSLPLAAVNVDEPAELPAVPDHAYDEDAFDQGQPRVTNRFYLDTEQARPGDTIRAGLHFEMSPGWHIYWLHAGQGGMSTQADFQTDSAGANPGPTLWPEPTVYHEAGGAIITFGYGDTVLLYSEISVPDDADESIEISVDVDYLVCEIDCIPGQAVLTRTLQIGDETIAADSPTLRLFDESQARLPRQASETGIDVEVRYSHAPITESDQFRVEISAIGCQEAGQQGCVILAEPPERPADAFVYDGIDTVRFDVARASPHPTAHSGWFIELSGRTSRDAHSGDGRLNGVLRLRTDDGTALPTIVDVLFPRTDSEEARALTLGENASLAPPAEGPAVPTPDSTSLFYVLLLAFLGGALLNLMPCVFPVLAIKVFSFVNLVHEERQSIYSHSATYTAGIVASMMVLAGVVIGLQILGTQVGWGFQFQEPRFIAAVGAVLIIFALNLFGVFEVTLNPGRLQEVAMAPASHRRSFGEGVLAVVLATPCSAPFLGTAVGFALANSPWVIALIFLVLGLGLAMPFVVLTMVPGAAHFLPRPGPWMTHFKQLLGFALLATAIWLIWLIGQFSGTAGITRLLIFFLACGLAAWVFGLTQYRSAAARRVGILVAIVIIAVAGFFTLRFDDASPTQSADVDHLIAWMEWNEEDVQAELANGRPVFVDFTADWCITCKVNEANVLEHLSVREVIEELDVAMFMADWTRRDERIRSKLAEFGKAGVPLYLVYSPDDPHNPRVLPELLTRQMVISALQEIAPDE